MGVALLSGESVKYRGADRDLAGKMRIFFDLCLRRSIYVLVSSDLVSLTFFLYLSLNDNSRIYLTGVILLLGIWMSLSFFKRTYEEMLTGDAEVVVRRIFYHWLIFSVIAWLLYPILFEDIFDYKMFLLSLLFSGTYVFTTRIVFLSIRKKYKHLIIKKRRIAIIGTNIYTDRLVKNIHKGCNDFQIEGCYKKEEINFSATTGKHYSGIHLMALKGINEIYCCSSTLDKNEIQQLLQEADRYMIRVRFLPDELLFGEQIRFETVNHVPVFALRPEPLLSDKNKMIKRSFDIVFSLFVIVFTLSWLTPIVWIAIRLESRGPLLFRQKRTGMDNHNFYCYKFRSMVSGNPTSNTLQASKNDQRITRVGAILRKTSIDELPQFVNVLWGDMSVVGPRPHMIFHTKKYRKEIGAYMIRHYVKPGITGLAQINGYRGPTRELEDMELRVEHDIDYLENWTFMLDMKIIFLTIWSLFHYDENAC